MWRADQISHWELHHNVRQENSDLSICIIYVGVEKILFKSKKVPNHNLMIQKIVPWTTSLKHIIVKMEFYIYGLGQKALDNTFPLWFESTVYKIWKTNLQKWTEIFMQFFRMTTYKKIILVMKQSFTREIKVENNNGVHREQELTKRLSW